MATIAQQLDALQVATVQADYDGAWAELEQTFARGLMMTAERYPAAGMGQGTRDGAEALRSLAATLDAVFIGLTLPRRKRYLDAPYADAGQGREPG